MKTILSIILLLILNSLAFSSDHGIYTKVVKGINQDIETVGEKVKSIFEESDFTVLNYLDIGTPDIIKENEKERCGHKAKVLILSSPSYRNLLTSFGNKYLVASFIRVGIYESNNGVNIVITDPETINRIIFNDLWEDGEEEKYNSIVEKTIPIKKSIIDFIHTIEWGTKVSETLPPVRSDEDLKESSKDMFMMVGSMTFFNDEDQFPIIYEISNTMGTEGLSYVRNKIDKNLENFVSIDDDKSYRFTKSPDVLKWKIVSEVYSPDSTSILLGITRTRTEGLSFSIAGVSRETDELKCPGIDHASAYPIEVLITQEDGKIIIRTARQMFRMDMYFWDAGMPAFMDHMGMPGMLDESLRRAILANDYTE